MHVLANKRDSALQESDENESGSSGEEESSESEPLEPKILPNRTTRGSRYRHAQCSVVQRSQCKRLIPVDIYVWLLL